MTDAPDPQAADAEHDPGHDADLDADHEAGRPRGRDRLGRALAAVAVVALLAGLAVLAVGVMRHRDAQHAAEDRDTAVGVASQVLVNAYSFDFSTIDASLERLKADSTGDFLAQQEQWGPDVRKRVTEQKAVTTAKVGNAAVEDFDDDAGTGRVLFVFTAESKREKLPPVTGRQAAVVAVQRVDDAWKVSAVTPVGVVVPVGDSSASVQGLGGDQAAPGGSAAPKSGDAKATGTEKPAPTSTGAAKPAPKSSDPKKPAASTPAPSR